MIHYIVALIAMCPQMAYGKTYPIQFSIPESKIVTEIPYKDRDWASIIPGKLSTYIYDNEADYYQGYQRSYFAVTSKKGGWDCMRHYEILANGCIPYFIDIQKCDAQQMLFLPRRLMAEATTLPGLGYPAIDHALFNKEQYYQLLTHLLEHTRRYLTTRAMAHYMLDCLNYAGTGNILFLSHQPTPDYMRDCALIGLREALGERVIDCPKIDFVYKSYEGDIQCLYGKGMTYSRNLDDIPLDRTNIVQRIKNREFDLIIYGSAHRGLWYHDLVREHYPSSKIVYICGEEGHTCPFHNTVEHLFLREFIQGEL